MLSQYMMWNHHFFFAFWIAGDIELMKAFLSKGVNVDLQSDAGSPLIWAAGHGQQDSVKLLLEHNANVSNEHTCSILLQTGLLEYCVLYVIINLLYLLLSVIHC